MFAEQTPTEIVFMPPRLNVYDGASRLKPGVRDAAVPIVKSAADRLALSFLSISKSSSSNRCAPRPVKPAPRPTAKYDPPAVVLKRRMPLESSDSPHFGKIAR
jgi:hypothetical protein